MYEASFGLARRPFSSVPRIEQYFPATAIESARQTLVRCIERCEGVGLLVGPSGTGKTLLCQMLADRFQETFQVVLLSSGRLGTRKALLQAILFELGQPYRGMDEGELRLAMVDYLTTGDGARQGMVLLVDEAHTLPLRLLEEIRIITNLVCHGEPRTRLVLSGGAALEERLASPKLESFAQRIAARCYLESLSRSETDQYILAHLDSAGASGPEIFPADSCEAVYRATDGIPRLINQVCDHALLLACSQGCKSVDRAGVEEAWADLQQLPTPWEPEDGMDNSEQVVIEFGGLDDDDGDEIPIDGTDEDDDEARCLPMLRVTNGSDEPEEPPREAPDKQVEQIQEALADMDKTPQPEPTGRTQEPAGESPGEPGAWEEPKGEPVEDVDDLGQQSGELQQEAIGPAELTLVGSAEDPFSEPFEEEEEILVERFGPGKVSPRGVDIPAQSPPAEAETEPPPEAAVEESPSADNEPARDQQTPLPPAGPPEQDSIGHDVVRCEPADAASRTGVDTGPADQSNGSGEEQPPAVLIQVEAHAGSPLEETTPLVCQADAVAVQTDLSSQRAEPFFCPAAETPLPACELVPVDPGWAGVQPRAFDPWGPEPETVPFDRPATSSPNSVIGEEICDKDLIVVEEGYGDLDTTRCPRSRVRRQEYRELFARLRRGERG